MPATLNWLGYKSNSPAHSWTFAIVAVFASIYGAWAYRSLYIKPSRLAMQSEGYAICINCGYELKGLGEDIDRCPECGSLRKGSD